MNNEIGKENLPNCYVKNIEIIDLNRLENLITVSMFTKDMNTGDGMLWYDNEDMYKYMDVLVLLSADPNVSNQLTNGALPLDKKKILRRNRNNRSANGCSI